MFALAAVACSLSLPAQTASISATATLANTQQPVITLTITTTPLPASKTPTETRTPYPTITPIPTDTPIPSVTPLGAGPTPTQAYGCQLIDKYPDNWMQIKARTPFEARWTLKNTGTKIWYPNDLTLNYMSGVKMHLGKDYQKLTRDTAPDGLLLLIVDMVSPKNSGRYAATWALVDARTENVLCSFTAKITVK